MTRPHAGPNLFAAALTGIAFPFAARADDPSGSIESLRIEASPAMRFAWQPPASPPSAAERHRFGAEGTRLLTIGAGIAWDFDKAVDLNIPRLAYSYFLSEDVEWSLELNGWRFIQEGSDAWGINPVMIFRWHFINTGAWSVYADGGVGVLLATDHVPDGGTTLNFTPRIGMGFTRQITEGGARLQVGLRWHHISNARIAGDVRNPSRDAPLLYAAIVFPF
jgi:hypothetical protein